MYKKIMVALDGSQVSTRALSEAIKMASLMQGTLHAVCVVDTTPLFSYAGDFDPLTFVDALRQEGRATIEHAEKTCKEAGVTCESEIVETEKLSDDVAQTLQRCAERMGAELVVLGTHGRRGLRRAVLGSVAERFIRFATCPVMLVRGADAKAEAEAEAE